MPSVFKRITKYNANRIPEYTALKMQFMTENVFRFFRGTCHLFYEDLSKGISWKDNTQAWICGDLHLENFGSYKGNNGIVYFDLNDFDESVLAPVTWEIARFLTSIYVGADVAGYNGKTADALCRKALQVYLDTLKQGKAVVVEKQSASGLLRYFLSQVEQRKEDSFIKSRIIPGKKNPKLLIDHKKTYPVTEATKEKVITTVETWFRKTMPDKKAKVLDVAFRIAGTGSVGVHRYVLLVQAGSKLHLLDLKASNPSSLNRYVKIKQPSWSNETERIVALQDRIQQVSPKMLHALKMEKTDYVIKALQPTQDRMDLTLCKGKLDVLEDIIGTMAGLSASGQLRSSGRQHSSIADELIAFAGHSDRWSKSLLDYARNYAAQVQEDYATYKEEYNRYNAA